MHKRSVLAALIFAVFAVVVACGEDTAAAEPTQIPTGVVFDKQSVTVDGVIEGQDVTQTFLVMNRSLKPAIVNHVEVLDASECDQVEVPDSTFVVPPESVSLMTVHMRGHKASTSPHTVSLGLQTVDGGDSVDALTIVFQGVKPAPGLQSGPRLGIDRTSIDIGKIPYDWPMHEQLRLYNYGDQPLSLGDVPLIRVLEGC